MEDKRDEIVDIIQREFIGPDPSDDPGLLQENGEEILTESPVNRYPSGVLFAKKSENSGVENQNDDEIKEYHDDQVAPEQDDDFEEVMNLSNAFRQSAISMTVCIRRSDILNVEVNAAIYKPESSKADDEQKAKTKYYRIPLHWNNEDKNISLPSKENRMVRRPISDNEKETGLRFNIAQRYEDVSNDLKIITLSLENTNEETGRRNSISSHFFQSGFKVTSSLGFQPLPNHHQYEYREMDQSTNELLYRHKQCYAIGHGCSATWNEENSIDSIETSFIPKYEVKPIIPSTIENVDLDMRQMSSVDSFSNAIISMKRLGDKYEKWIDGIENKAKSLPEHHRKTSLRHVDECRKALRRIRDGIKILENDSKSAVAFRLMNRAMLEQQLRHNLPIQEWKEDEEGTLSLDNKINALPVFDDHDTWYDKENRVYGKWRPFQLAFILMNINGLINKDSEERRIVDLIWFPTGGGKTEAYLGLSAFSIFMRRLKNPDNNGTDIIMRYTLRLLTAQQYERASSLICACEIIRKENSDLLGEERISIGLWIGGSSTPNKIREAKQKFNRLYNGESEDNPFPIHRCPRCGARMGVVTTSNKKRHIIGYNRSRQNIQFVCENRQQGCEFSSIRNPLPMHVIDEDIYKTRPTFVLGTVDKFATLPFQKDSRMLFGLNEDPGITPPSLIIQDELHLISGPLGSMVGHYETLIDHLSTRTEGNNIHKPKIIASTATISRAREQCNALYACGKGNVFLFPPQGLEEGESFFARKADDKNGRLYTGIMVSGETSQATTAIRLYASLLYAGKALDASPSSRDPYWTNIAYFNSIRELGQMATWIRQDIKEYLQTIYRRKNIKDYDNRRFINDKNILELTSRIKGDEVSSALHNLEIPYNGEKDNYPADIALATNMISVGLDVSRLGLMTVNGQPKTTAEYIQSTSRVGRDAENAPGIIFTIYNPARPRDRSHYEQFQYYHSRLYAEVEPTSVTPFSEPVLDRALHAVIIGMMRLSDHFSVNLDNPTIPTEEDVEKALKILKKRVTIVDQSAVETVEKKIKEIILKWKNSSPDIYMENRYQQEKSPLMNRSGGRSNKGRKERSFPIPTSMRSVDASCKIDIRDDFYND